MQCSLMEIIIKHLFCKETSDKQCANNITSNTTFSKHSQNIKFDRTAG